MVLLNTRHVNSTCQLFEVLSTPSSSLPSDRRHPRTLLLPRPSGGASAAVLHRRPSSSRGASARSLQRRPSSVRGPLAASVVRPWPSACSRTFSTWGPPPVLLLPPLRTRFTARASLLGPFTCALPPDTLHPSCSYWKLLSHAKIID